MERGIEQEAHGKRRESKSRSKEGSTQRSRYFGLEQGDGPSKTT